MKNKFSFDEHVKQALEDYEQIVPSFLWDQINKKTNRKKPVFFWLSVNSFLISIIMIILGGGIYYIIKPTRTFNIASTQTKSLSTELSAEMKKENRLLTTDPVSKSNHKIQHKTTATEINASNPSIDHFVEKENSNQPTADPIVSTSTIQKKNINVLNLRKYNKTVHNIEMSASSTTWMKTNANELSNTNFVSSNKGLFGFSLNPQLQSVRNEINPSVTSLIKSFVNIPCPTLNPKKSKQYFDFYSSYDFIIRQFSDTPNSLYLEKRKEGNTISSAFSVGLRYTKLFNSGLTIRGGFNYSKINEKFSFIQGNIIQVLYETNAAGDTIRTYQTESTRYKITHNRYATIDIPITLGYEKTLGDFTINANTGILLNLISQYRGDILNKDLQPIAINSSQSENQYRLKNNIGIGYLGAITLYYQLSDRFKLLAEPYFRYNVSPMNEFSSGFKQQYHTVGFKAGIRFDLQ